MKVYIERNEEGTFSIYDASTNDEVEYRAFTYRWQAEQYAQARQWAVGCG